MTHPNTGMKWLPTLIGLAFSMPALADGSTPADTAAPSCTQAADGRERPESCPVKGSAESAELADIVVVANRMPLNANLYAGQTARIDGNRLKGTSRLIESLDGIPGINHGNDVGRQVGQALTIRGFGYGQGGRLIIEQDGVPRDPMMYSQQISSFRTDTDTLKRVETVQGASSVLHGSGAIGGVISMQTKDASDYLLPGREIGVGIGARYESNNMHSVMTQLYGQPQNLPIDFLLHTKYARYGAVQLADGGGGYFTAGRYKRLPETKGDDQTTTTLAKIGWNITPEQRLGFSVFNLNSNMNYVWQAVSVADADLPGIDTPTAGWLRQRDYVLDYRYSPENPLIDLNAKAYYSRTVHDRFNHGVRTQDRLSNYDRRWGFSLKNNAEFETGALRHRLVSGAEYRNAEQNFSHTRPGGWANDLQAFPNESRDTSIYLQDHIRYGRWLFTLGGRFDRFDRRVNLPGRQAARNSRFSPRAALAFEAAPGFNLLAGYAETFRAPTPVETGQAGNINVQSYMVPNPDLKPELAKEYEIGFSLAKDNLFNLGHRLNLKATYFDGKVEDMINLSLRDDLGLPPTVGSYPNQRYRQYRNLREVERSGYEIDLRYQTDNWRFGLSYGQTKLYDTQARRLASAYAGKLNAYAFYTHRPWDLTLGVELRHWLRPKNPQSHSNMNSPNPYNRYVHNSSTQVNLKGSWEPTQTGSAFWDGSTSLSFGVNNVFDRQAKRAGDFDLSTDAVGTGRNFYLQFEKRF